MEAVSRIYEKMPKTIEIPEEMQDQSVEVIFLPLNDLAKRAAEIGMKLEDVKDLHGLRFAGSMPDLPPRAPQGEYPVRLELDFDEILA
ncbi:MAG TPA: hypothetical protein PLD20_25705 [Blastocatellia bacterium]|nr:hypothetical protein [Blastocatellia bacterium]HMV84696.1 hypothetical protein [Blastocatellia bacterium]HMX25381.1 hypothetical protein [Blastocatellia bacterium]HMY74142.1 hypothetical protein [Blastocatellia bacterium]HMZ21354.1 hypothetical protein [Blastocatellia bacterium]